MSMHCDPPCCRCDPKSRRVADLTLGKNESHEGRTLNWRLGAIPLHSSGIRRSHGKARHEHGNRSYLVPARGFVNARTETQSRLGAPSRTARWGLLLVAIMTAWFGLAGTWRLLNR